MTPGNPARRIPLVVLANILAAAGGMGFQILLSRRLGPAVFGTYVAITTFLYALCHLFESYSLTIAKDLTIGSIQPLHQTVFRFALVLGLGTFLLFAVYDVGPGRYGIIDIGVYAAIALSLLVWSVLWMLRGAAQGLRMETAYISSRTIELLSRLGLGVLIFAVMQNLALALLAGALGAGVAVGHLYFSVRRMPKMPADLEPSKPLADHLFQFAKMAAAYLPLALFIRLDMILAPQMFSPDNLGVYGVLSTVGKAALIYSLAIAPIIFPYLVKSESQREWLKWLGIGSLVSTGFLAAIYLVFQFAGAALVRLSFGIAYAQAASILPYYLLALIPVALHCNVINVQLARGRFWGTGILWVGLGLYYLILKYLPGSMTAYIGYMAAAQGILSIIGLLIAWLTNNSRPPLRLKSRIIVGDRAAGPVEPVGGHGAASQIEGNRQAVVG